MTLRFWRVLARRALRHASTPCFLFAAEPVAEALAELDALDPGIPIRHWFSCKTQPLPPLLRWWQRRGRPIEVVSEFEYVAARRAGFSPNHILVNGPAKDYWLPRRAERGLTVNFDSRRELDALLPLARSRGWRLGIRLLTNEEFDPVHPEQPTQFGMDPQEALSAIRRLRRAGLQPEILHFHLRTNVASATVYERALAETAAFCQCARFQPRYLDCGGGLPPRHTASPDGRLLSQRWTLRGLQTMYRRALPQFPGVQELWLENGRFLVARSGALLITILEVKERRGLRQLICDGGRTLHALVSTWEQHRLVPLAPRPGRRVLTAVHGPTCMAFDRLACLLLPASLGPGDQLLWLEAGAYHLPWENRFSHGLAAVLWHEAGRLRVVRQAETPDGFGGLWVEDPLKRFAPRALEP